jgi:hypothetical protein
MQGYTYHKYYLKINIFIFKIKLLYTKRLKTQFSSYFNSKTPHQHPHNTHKPLHQLQIPKKGFKNSKSNRFSFGVLV